MYKYSYTILLFLLSLSYTCFAQETVKLSGYLKDQKSNEIIDYANIALLDCDSTFLEGTTSDSTGYFSFIVHASQKRYVLKIHHLNYNRKIIEIPSLIITEPKIYFLEEKDNFLSEVFVLGEQTRTTNNLKLSYKVPESLKQESVRATQILENIPTVFIDYNQNIYIKGKSNILILKNGIELANKNLVDQIPPSTIEKIEILNTIPSKYANKNYTSIMNIITKRESNNFVLLDNNSSYDKKMYDAKINLSIDTKKHSAYIFYKLYYRNFEENYSIKNKDIDTVSITNYKIKPRKELDNEFFYGYSFYPNKNIIIGIDGYYSLYRENFVHNNNSTKKDLYAKFKEKFDTQNYKAYINHQDSLNKFQGIIRYTSNDIVDNFSYNNEPREEHQTEKRQSCNIRLDYNRQISSKLSLTGGVEYFHTINKNYYNVIGLSDHSRDRIIGNIYTGYLESTFQLNNHWTFEGGININHYKRSFKNNTKVSSFNIYPKAIVGYSINDNNALKLAYSSFIQNPNIWQMLPSQRKETSDIYSRGNPYLKPEKYSTFSIEYSYYKGNLYLSANLYFKQAKNKIQNITQKKEDYILLTYTNLKNRNDYGIDFTFNKQLTEWWVINAYFDLRNRHIGENYFYKKNMISYSGNIQTNWAITKKVSLSAQYMYNSKELVYNGIAQSFNSSLAVLKYKILDNLNVYLMAIEPLGKFENKSKIYSENGYVEKINNIKTRTFLISFTYNLFNNNSKSRKKAYINDEKKY